MPASGGGDILLWVGLPNERLWLFVVNIDEGVDRLLQVDECAEHTVLEPPPCQFGGEAINSVYVMRDQETFRPTSEGNAASRRRREHEVGVKWNVHLGCRTSHVWTF